MTCCNLAQDDIDRLKEFGVNGVMDLAPLLSERGGIQLLTQAGIKPLIALRILDFAEYFLVTDEIHEGITATDIRHYLDSRKKPKARKHRVDDSSEDDNDDEDEVDKHLIKPDINGTIPTFSNNPIEFEDYWKRAETKLKMTKVGRYLHQEPSSSQQQKDLNKMLHCILQTAFQDMTAEVKMKASEKVNGESRYHTAKAITAYYRSDEQKAEICNMLNRQINGLKLEGNPDSFVEIGAYINKFQMLYNRLVDNGEDWKDKKVRDKFLGGIKLEHSNTIMVWKANLWMNQETTFKSAIKAIKSVARKLDPESDNEDFTKSHRTGTSTGKEKLARKDFHIPDYVIQQAKKAETPNFAVGVILKWKKVFVEEGHQIRSDELSSFVEKYGKRKSDPNNNSTSSGRDRSGKRNKRGGRTR